MAKSSTSSRRSNKVSAQGTEDLNQRIREKAFELYQRRGGTHGADQADWLEAERIVLQGNGQSRATTSRKKTARKPVD